MADGASSLGYSSYSGLQLSGFVISLSLLYLFSVGIYRLYLSPLTKYPGPGLAALTTLYEFYYDYIKPGKYEWKIKEMHAKYGPIVRITPRELHIDDPDYLETLFNQKLDKDPWVAGQFGSTGSTLSTASSNLHRIRRAAVAPFFSPAKVAQLQSVVTDKIEHVCQKLQEYHVSGKPANMYNLYRGMTTDIITEYAFLESWNFLDRDDSGQQWFQMIQNAGRSSALLRQFRWLAPTLQALPRSLAQVLVPDMKASFFMWDILDKELLAMAKAGPDAPNVEKKHPTVLYELMFKSRLPPSEKEHSRLRAEGELLVVAGADTTGWVLNTLHFHLLSNPEKMTRLKAELAEAIMGKYDVPSLEQLKKLPYLSACIDEALRISGGVPHRLARMAPKGGLEWQNRKVPEGTPVSMSFYSIHMNADIFHQPQEFQPERWLKPEAEGLRKYLSPFSKGPRWCLGLELASADLYLATAMIHRRFNTELFETTREDIDVAHDFFIGHPKLGSKGLQVKVN